MRASLGDFLLPPVCALCKGNRASHEMDLVCGMCWSKAVELPRPRCDRCGHPYNPRRKPVACTWCALLPPYVRAARSCCAVPGGSAGTIVHALKYQGWSAAAAGMGRRMAALRFPPDVEQERAALIPVPLSPSRLRERGYNQSAELARHIASVWGIPVREDILVRGRATTTQTRLTPGERKRNVSGAFHTAVDRNSLRGQHLILVDDVVTTAATLNECAAALHDGGTRIVSFVTFGRAPALGDRW
jgi:Predicted amidophosphoribosyltransferases